MDQGIAIRSQDVTHKGRSDEELLAYLEQISGRKIKTRQDIAAYVDDLSRRARVKHSKRQQLKNALLAGLFLFALFQYYFIDVQLQILAQPTLTVFYPTKDVPPRPGTRI